jgi:hypothetical protein
MMHEVSVYGNTYNIQSAPKHVQAELLRLLEKHGGSESQTDFDALSLHKAVLHKANDLCQRFGTLVPPE